MTNQWRRKMELGLSQKGKRKILREGYIYVYNKELKNNICSFECELLRKGQLAQV